jgi:hypothetical protein
MASSVVVTQPFSYVDCPMCPQAIRFTNKVTPDGLVEHNEDAIRDGIRIHLLFGCEAVER